MFVVQCPSCGKKQRTAPRKKVMNSKKKCVYCSRTFKIHSGGINTRIVQQNYDSGPVVSFENKLI